MATMEKYLSKAKLDNGELNIVDAPNVFLKQLDKAVYSYGLVSATVDYKNNKHTTYFHNGGFSVPISKFMVMSQANFYVVLCFNDELKPVNNLFNKIFNQLNP